MSREAAELIVVCVLMAIAAVLSCILGVRAGCRVTRAELERSAIEAGHAEYYLDHNHQRQWRWKPTNATPPDARGQERDEK